MAYTNFTGPVQADFGFQTASYTVADLPAVEDNIFLIASDANGGIGTVVFGKNGQWIDARTDLPVSTNPPTSVPVVLSISPSVGSTAGGTNVTITGFNFTGATAVTIGGTAVASFSVVNDSSITAVTAAHAAGASSVNVTNAYGTNPANTLYTYQVPGVLPVISNTSVAGGYVQGGACNFVINGTNFSGVLDVQFNGNSATYTTLSSTQIQITNIPSGTVGSASIVVLTAGGASTPYTGWSYVQTATITSITPNTASNAGGTSLTVAGYGFNNSGNVQFLQSGYSPVSATPSVTNDNQITLTSPACFFNSAVDVRVYNNAFGYSAWQSGLFTFTAAPTFPIISSVTVPGGNIVGGDSNFDLIGSNFIGTTSVTFNGNSATFSVNSDSDISITNFPAGSAGAASIVVTNASGASTPYTGWSYVTQPVLTLISPNSGQAGSATGITYVGYGFNSSPLSYWQLGGSATAPSINILNDNVGSGSTPTGLPTGSANVCLLDSTYNTGPFLNNAFTFTAPLPEITIVNGAPSGSQQSGAYAYGIPSNANIAVDGSGFTGATNVYIQGQPTGFTVNSDTSITINSTLSDSVGLKSIQVETPVGLSANYSKFVYTDVPVITQMVPTSGVTTGGTGVSIYGYGFTTMNSFQFFGTNNESVVPTVVNDSYAVLTTPAYATAEAVQVRGSNPIGGAGAFVSGLWSFTAPPTWGIITSAQTSYGNSAAGNIMVNANSGTTLLASVDNDLITYNLAGKYYPAGGPLSPSSTQFNIYPSLVPNPTTNNLGMSRDGRMMVALDPSTNFLYSAYTTTPFDFSSRTNYGPSGYIKFFDRYVAGWTCDYSGYKVYCCDVNFLYQWNLSTQYSVVGIDYTNSIAYNVGGIYGGNYTNIRAIDWNQSGTTMYALTAPSSGQVYMVKFTFSTPWDITTISGVETLFNLTVNLSPDTILENYHSLGLSVNNSENKATIYVHTTSNSGLNYSWLYGLVFN